MFHTPLSPNISLCPLKQFHVLSPSLSSVASLPVGWFRVNGIPGDLCSKGPLWGHPQRYHAWGSLACHPEQRGVTASLWSSHLGAEMCPQATCTWFFPPTPGAGLGKEFKGPQGR